MTSRMRSLVTYVRDTSSMITRLSRRSDFQAVTAGVSHALDEAFHALVVRPERVLAQHGALGLVVQLEVHPVDGEVPPALLGALDEVAAQPGTRGLRRDRLGLEDRQLVGHARDGAALLEQVVEPALAVDVVVGQIELGNPGMPER